MTDNPKVRANYARHLAAQKRMQTGIAFDRERNDIADDGKHLRVGVNTALVDAAALVGLLISKGVITEEEYSEAIAIGMDVEVQRIERALSERYGTKVTLHEAGLFGSGTAGSGTGAT